MQIDTHIEMLVVRIENAESLGHLLRGVRRSKTVAIQHGVHWSEVKHTAFGSVREQRARKAAQ